MTSSLTNRDSSSTSVIGNFKHPPPSTFRPWKPIVGEVSQIQENFDCSCLIADLTMIRPVALSQFAIEMISKSTHVSSRLGYYTFVCGLNRITQGVVTKMTRPVYITHHGQTGTLNFGGRVRRHNGLRNLTPVSSRCRLVPISVFLAACGRNGARLRRLGN